MKRHFPTYTRLLTICLLASYLFIVGSTIVFAQSGEESSSPDTETNNEDVVETKTAEEIPDLIKPPSQVVNFDVRNPGNSPFIHDATYSVMEGDRYGTIRNDKAYLAFNKIIEFGIKTLIKLVGVMALFGITEGVVRLVVAHGDESISENGIKMITWSTIGLILALLAHALVTALLQFVLGVGDVSI